MPDWLDNFFQALRVFTDALMRLVDIIKERIA